MILYEIDKRIDASPSGIDAAGSLFPSIWGNSMPGKELGGASGTVWGISGRVQHRFPGVAGDDAASLIAQPQDFGPLAACAVGRREKCWRNRHRNPVRLRQEGAVAQDLAGAPQRHGYDWPSSLDRRPKRPQLERTNSGLGGKSPLREHEHLFAVKQGFFHLFGLA
jgi:hypothetical protein